MTQPPTEGLQADSGLIPPFTGMKDSARFRDAAAPVTLGESPKFCVYGGPQVARTVVIAKLKVKRGHRELEISHGSYINQVSSSKGFHPVAILQASDTALEISPKDPLTSGQYLLLPGGGFGIQYDFGVDSKAGTQ
jgi:hypothetical protein